jgi:hypothetical protein
MDQSSVYAKIRALFAKTVENGATVEEAIAAAEKARFLMEKYQIEDLMLDGTPPKFGWTTVKKKTSAAINMLVEPINKLCGTGGGYVESMKRVIFFGAADDVEFAAGVYAALSAICSRDFRAYQKTDTYKDAFKQATAADIEYQFTRAFVCWVGVRVDEIIASRAAATSNALVVIKDDLKAEAGTLFGISEKAPSKDVALRTYDAETVMNGIASADKAALVRQLGQSAQKEIGG